VSKRKIKNKALYHSWAGLCWGF